MEKEQILDFTRRISQSNRSGLTVINYEIIFAYLDDAKKAYREEKWKEFKVALRKAQNSIGELMQTLDFSYDISRNLYRIYVFCKDSLAAAMYKRSLTEIENAEKMLRKLYQSFCKVAETDSSAPMMKNTQQVYAGYTYGKGDLVENCQELDKSRGFFGIEASSFRLKCRKLLGKFHFFYACEQKFITHLHRV